MKKTAIIYILTLLFASSSFAQKAKPITVKQAITNLQNSFFGEAIIEGNSCTISLISLESVMGGLTVEIKNTADKRMSVTLAEPDSKVWLSRDGYETKYDISDDSSDPIGSMIIIQGYEDISDFDLTLIHIGSMKTMTCTFQE